MFLVKKNMGPISSGTVELEISELLITGSNRMTSHLTRIMMCWRLNELNKFCSGNKVSLIFSLGSGRCKHDSPVRPSLSYGSSEVMYTWLNTGQVVLTVCENCTAGKEAG